MTQREQFADRAIASLKRSCPEAFSDPSVVLLVREWIGLAWDISSTLTEVSVHLSSASANASREAADHEEDEADDSCDNCSQDFAKLKVPLPIDVYGDGNALVCSERCMLEMKAHDQERWAR